MDVIKFAEETGYDVLMIDSLSHVWNGAGGFLDQVNRVAKNKYHNERNTYNAWNDVTPLYQEFIDLLTDSRLHLICTMRTKNDTVMEKNEQTGRNEVKKLGVAPVQRDNLEYEFDFYFQMEPGNTLRVEKARYTALNGLVVAQPTGDFIEPVKRWLADGSPAPAPIVLEMEGEEEPQEPPVSEIRALVQRAKPTTTKGKLLTFEQFYEMFTHKTYTTDAEIGPDACVRMKRYLEGQLSKQAAQAAQQAAS